MREAKLNARLLKLSREDAREKRRSCSTDSQNQNLKEKRKSLEMRGGGGGGGGEEKSTREDFIANAKNQLCMFYAKGYCMRGNSCWFSHEKKALMEFDEAGANVQEKRTFEGEMRQKRMLLRLVDYTVTVKTLDLEEYFSQFGEVLEVKFTGLSQEGWSNFNLEVRCADTIALQALQKECHSIKGTDVMVKQSRSRESRSNSGRGGKEKKSEQETGRSSRGGRDDRWRKRSRSRSPVSRTSKSFTREDSRMPEKRWRGSSKSRVAEENEAVSRTKEIKQERGEPCQGGLVQETDGTENIVGGGEMTKEHGKVKEEVEDAAKASEYLKKESDHLADILKEHEAPSKKVINGSFPDCSL